MQPGIEYKQSPQGDVLVCEFGVRVDAESVPAINEQIAMARALYNDLVACMRDIVGEMQAYIVGEAGEGATELQERIDALSQAFSDAKASDDEPAMRTIAAERRQLWRELGTALGATRKACRTEIKRYFDRIGKRSECDTYRIRCEYVDKGLGWATANAQLDAALQAFKKSMQRGQAPRFAIGAEKIQDTLALQFTQAGGVPVEALLAGRHGELAMRADAGCGRRRYGEFKFRLGPAKNDMYATGTWQYHRAIPADSHVGLARLVRRKIGKDTKWALQLMVKLPSPVRIDTARRQPLVAVHFGWSADINGRRVAAIADAADPGLARIIQLPPAIEASLQRAAEIQGERDVNRDAIVPALKQLDLTGIAALDAELQATARLPAQHISANRIHRLCRLLREADRLPQWLEDWRKADRLRWQAHTHIARRARYARRDFYRNLALSLAREYDAILIEPLDLAGAALKVDEATGEKTEFSRKARAGRTVAALYELESALRWAATKAQCAVLDLVAQTASSCGHCGGTVTASVDDHQALYCNDCGAVLDRKQNGAAIAWALANNAREDVVSGYWLQYEKNRRAHSEKMQSKRAKMAAGRARARAAVAQTANAE